jgi:hypothetical protein
MALSGQQSSTYFSDFRSPVRFSKSYKILHNPLPPLAPKRKILQDSVTLAKTGHFPKNNAKLTKRTYGVVSFPFSVISFQPVLVSATIHPCASDHDVIATILRLTQPDESSGFAARWHFQGSNRLPRCRSSLIRAGGLQNSRRRSNMYFLPLRSVKFSVFSFQLAPGS